jgi:hypothetical protein
MMMMIMEYNIITVMQSSVCTHKKIMKKANKTLRKYANHIKYKICLFLARELTMPLKWAWKVPLVLIQYDQATA